MIWFFALVIVVLIGIAVVIASGRLGGLPAVDHDRPDTVIPSGRLLTGEDIAASRFAVSVRGYRIDEVDTLLDRLATEVDRRDRKIAVLTDRIAGRDTEEAPDTGTAAEHQTQDDVADTTEHAWAPDAEAEAVPSNAAPSNAAEAQPARES